MYRSEPTTVASSNEIDAFNPGREYEIRMAISGPHKEHEENFTVFPNDKPFSRSSLNFSRNADLMTPASSERYFVKVVLDFGGSGSLG